ncbi:hypothetical protein NHJ13734_009616 [Beauveria thailandica]
MSVFRSVFRAVFIFVMVLTVILVVAVFIYSLTSLAAFHVLVRTNEIGQATRATALRASGFVVVQTVPLLVKIRTVSLSLTTLIIVWTHKPGGSTCSPVPPLRSTARKKARTTAPRRIRFS